MGARQANRSGVRTTGVATAVVEATFTRPEDVTQYTAGDVVANATGTTHAVITFANCALVKGGSGEIIGACLVSSANQATKPDLELWLFDTAPTAMEDNAAFDPTDAELRDVVGVIPFPVASFKIGTVTVGADGNVRCEGSTGGYPFVCASGSKDLYGILVERGTYTPVSAERFDLRLMIWQD